MHETQACLVTGTIRLLEFHHVRKHAGDQKDDTRGVMLTVGYHRIGVDAVETIGDRRFQEKFDVDFEAEIKRCNAEYVAQGGKL